MVLIHIIHSCSTFNQCFNYHGLKLGEARADGLVVSATVDSLQAFLVERITITGAVVPQFLAELTEPEFMATFECQVSSIFFEVEQATAVAMLCSGVSRNRTALN